MGLTLRLRCGNMYFIIDMFHYEFIFSIWHIPTAARKRVCPLFNGPRNYACSHMKVKRLFTRCETVGNKGCNKLPEMNCNG